ncbi:MAG: hypothetical protein ACREGL_05915, partial [Alphaproteobacteria bacterium]
MDGSRLVVEFDRPLSASLEVVPRRLKRYVTAARLAEDGKTALFDLAQPFELKTFRKGSSVMLDLIEPGRGTQSSDVGPGAAKPAAAEGAVPPATAQADSGSSPNGTGSENVVAGAIPVRADAAAGFDRLVIDWPIRVGYRVRERDNAVLVLFDRPGRLDVSRLDGASHHSIGRAESIDGRPGVVLRLELKGRVRPKHYREGTRVVVELHPLTEAQGGSTANPAEGGKEPATLVAKPDVARVTLGARAEGDVAVVRLDATEPGTAAVFRRAGAIWLVFDQPAALDLEAVRSAIGGVVDGVERIDDSRALVLRMPARPEVNARVVREERAWSVELSAQPARAASGVRIERRREGDGLLLAVEGAGPALGLVDPESGDRLVVVPLAAAGLGVDGGRRYVEFELPSTFQGIAVVPLADRLSVRSGPMGVEIGDGLVLSDGARAAEAERAQMGRRARLFDFPSWRRTGEEGSYAERQRLMGAIAEAPPEEVSEARLDLARFYFTHGFAIEALGLLESIARADTQMADNPDNRALRGVCRLLAGYSALAREDLMIAALDGSPEVALWRGVALARAGDHGAAVESFEQGIDLLADYPEPYGFEIMRTAAESALAIGRADVAEHYLNARARTALSDSEASAIHLLRARTLEVAGEKEESARLWASALEGRDARSRVEAALVQLDRAAAMDALTTDVEIRTLERLRFVWRGGELEFTILHRQGRAYLVANRYAEGLERLRTAITYFPRHREAPTVAKEMSDAFAN